MNLIDSISKRRTYYALSGETTISQQQIEELIKIALKHTPSAFNMQAPVLSWLLEKLMTGFGNKLWRL